MKVSLQGQDKGKRTSGGLSKVETDSVLNKEKEAEHKHKIVDFEMKITGIFWDALSRREYEAIRNHSRPS